MFVDVVVLVVRIAKIQHLLTKSTEGYLEFFLLRVRFIPE